MNAFECIQDGTVRIKTNWNCKWFRMDEFECFPKELIRCDVNEEESTNFVLSFGISTNELE